MIDFKILAVSSIFSLAVGAAVFWTSSEAPAQGSISNEMNKFRFISFEEWDSCAQSGYCTPLPKNFPGSKMKDPVLGVDFPNTKVFMRWYKLEKNHNAELLSVDEFWKLQKDGMLPENPNEISFFLEGCRASSDFQVPTADRLRKFGLPTDWPYKMNSSGQICKADVCTECQLAVSSKYLTEVTWVFSEGTYENTGILIRE